MSFRHTRILQKAFLESTVEGLKPRTAHVLPLAASLNDVVRLFEMAHAGSVLILDDEGGVQGIFTERDLLLKYQPGKALNEIKIPDVMTTPVQAINSRSSIARLLHLISLGGFRHVPVNASKGTDSPRIISVRDLIDFIYKAVAKKVIADGEMKVVDELMVEKFFAAEIGVLKLAKPVWIDAGALIIDAITTFKENRPGSLLVEGSGKSVIGLFTERDFTTRVVIPGRATTRTRVSEVMTKDPVTITFKTPIAQAFKLMSEGGYRNVPVVGPTGGIVGIVSTRDLINLLTESVLDELTQAHH